MEDEEVDESDCEEDEVNGNENESDDEEGKAWTPLPLLLYTVYGLIFHLGHLCCKHDTMHVVYHPCFYLFVHFTALELRFCYFKYKNHARLEKVFFLS